jgi:2-oxo-4-hydroxy-4-carboxy-5-ureidoimidazoline decarboxylase
MSQVLARWNLLRMDEAASEILPCCGSKAWAHAVVKARPFPDEPCLLAAADEIWRGLAPADWMEAFRSHPRIGESKAPNSAGRQSAAWSAQEQQSAAIAGDAVKIALAEANGEYERRFNRIFIVCASGKSADEILEILKHRLKNDEQTEIQEAAEQQGRITQLRLRKWLQG